MPPTPTLGAQVSVSVRLAVRGLARADARLLGSRRRRFSAGSRLRRARGLEKRKTENGASPTMRASAVVDALVGCIGFQAPSATLARPVLAARRRAMAAPAKGSAVR
eukprot:10003135-Alexandrium_andersonii.AAC.1